MELNSSYMVFINLHFGEFPFLFLYVFHMVFHIVFPATSFHGWHCPTKQGRICVTYVMTHAARIGQFEEVSSDPRQGPVW